MLVFNPQAVTLKAPDELSRSVIRRTKRSCCARVSSNAIVLTANRQAFGIGAGQQNRVESAAIAVRKADGRAGGGAAASDAFFPFRDGFDEVAKAGVRVVVEPGGSVRDQDVIDAANEHGIALIFTGKRHFRH